MCFFSDLNTATLSWKEEINAPRPGLYKYLKFAPSDASSKPIHFCVEYVEEKLILARGKSRLNFPRSSQSGATGH